MTIVVRDGLASKYFVAITRMTNDCSIPVTAVRPPPISSATHHLITHLRPLHRHTGITLGCGLYRQRIASSISLFHLREIDVERRTLVFLHTEIVGLAIRRDRESACQT